MRYYNYTVSQLEDKATELLIEFDEDRLHKTKPIDVYAVIEKCLDVPYDWKYLAPDQSVLGATAFSGGVLWVWPESKYYDGLMPYQIEVEPGTILIDATLTEQDNRGRENFTVMHEVFHQILHRNFFRTMPSDYIHYTTSRTIDGKIKYESYDIAMIEKQANACAAAFLMPAELITKTYKRLYRAAGYNRYNVSFVYNSVREMAEEFSVSKQAMAIRLQNLGIINENMENLLS